MLLACTVLRCTTGGGLLGEGVSSGMVYKLLRLPLADEEASASYKALRDEDSHHQEFRTKSG